MNILCGLIDYLFVEFVAEHHLDVVLALGSLRFLIGDHH